MTLESCIFTNISENFATYKCLVRENSGLVLLIMIVIWVVLIYYSKQEHKDDNEVKKK